MRTLQFLGCVLKSGVSSYFRRLKVARLFPNITATTQKEITAMHTLLMKLSSPTPKITTDLNVWHEHVSEDLVNTALVEQVEELVVFARLPQ